MSRRFRFDLIEPGATVLVALSGGADSMYLLSRLAEEGYPVKCAHYNHCLRPTADRDEQFVRDWCSGQGISLSVGRGDVAARAAKRGMSVEECAREMRYAFLEQTAREEGCALIATGHHAGDNAETVLMNLIRGSGLKGLCGIPERRGNLVRPMLEVTREEIDDYLTRRGIPHVEDETNGDDGYTRNKVRHHLMPLMEELNPRAREHITAAAGRLRDDEILLSQLAEELLCRCREREDGLAIPAEDLANAPRPLALRACGILARRAGLGTQSAHLEGILALCRGDSPSGETNVPGGTVWREYEWLVLGHRDSPPGEETPLCADGITRWGRWTVECHPSEAPEKPYLHKNSFHLRPGEYTLRTRREGDKVKLGKRPEKTVKKLMIEERIPARRREHIPVIAGDGTAAAVGGFGPDARFLAKKGQPSLHITLTEENET